MSRFAAPSGEEFNGRPPANAELGGGFKYVSYVHPYLVKFPILTNIFQRG